MATIEQAGRTATHPAPSDARAGARRPRLSDVWAALAIAIPAVLALHARLPTIDLAYHVRLGDAIRATGSIPRVDALSFAADRPWVDQQWGAQVLLSAVHELGGFAGLVITRAALVGAIAAILLAMCRRRGAGGAASCALTVAACVVAWPYLALRPQLFGAALFAAMCAIVAERARRPRLLWFVPPIVLVWVNLHGSFVLAVLVLAFALADDLLARRRRARATAAVLAVAVAATACNPFGVAVYRYVVALGVDETIRTAVEEWRPPTMQTLAGATFLIALLLVGGLLARRGRRLSWVELAAAGTFTVLALTAQRNVLWWAIAVTPLAAAMVGAAPGRVRSADAGHRAGNVVLLALVGVVGVASLPWGRTADQLVRDAPTAPIVDAVQALPDGSRLFVFQPWASWTELAAPGRPVFVDSRIELFAASTWEDYRSTISGGGDALATLGRWGVDAVVVPRSEGLADVLTASEDWRLDVAAGEGVLFVRSRPA